MPMVAAQQQRKSRDSGAGGRHSKTQKKLARTRRGHSCMSSCASSTATAVHRQGREHAGQAPTQHTPGCASTCARRRPSRGCPAARTLELCLLLACQRPGRLDQVNLLLQLPPLRRQRGALGLGHARLVEAVLARAAHLLHLLDRLDCTGAQFRGGSREEAAVRARRGMRVWTTACAAAEAAADARQPAAASDSAGTHPSCAPARGRTSRGGCAAAPSQTWRPAGRQVQVQRHDANKRGPAVRQHRAHHWPSGMHATSQSRATAPLQAPCRPACGTPWST